jgi:transcriptional regulator with XRE-family HTH domain
MEVSIAVNIRTPYGEVVLIPQGRNLLLASSGEPFQYGGNTILLWAMLEREHQTWGVSDVVAPLVYMIDGSGRTSSIASESIAAELLKSVSLLAGEWAAAHPEAFECAAAAAFKIDQEGLNRDLGGLRESLTSSAQAIESITAEAPSEHSARLRAYSQNMRSMAVEVPAIQQIAQALKFRGEALNLPSELPNLSSRGAPATRTKANHLRNVAGSRKNSDQRVIAGSSVSGPSLWTNQLTLSQLLKKQRKDIGLSQQELALKLGVKASHVTQLESDSGARPSFQLLSRVASVLGLDKDRLVQLAERGTSPSSAAPRASRLGDTAQVWGPFARNRALLDRHNVRPKELKALSEVSLMGKITGSKALLFILDAIRDAEDTEE